MACKESHFQLLLLALCILSLIGVCISSPLLSLPFLVGATIATLVLAVISANAGEN